MPARSFRIGSTLAGVALLLAAAGCSTGGTAVAVPGVSISSSSTESSSSSTSDTSTSDAASSSGTSTSSDSSSQSSTADTTSTAPSSTASSGTASSSTASSEPESITTPSETTGDTSPATTGSSSTEHSTSDAPKSTTATPSVSPAPGGKLDPATATWFINGCNIQRELRALTSPKTSGSLTDLKKQVSTAYAKLSAVGASGKSRLSGIAAPDIPGGAKFKAAQVARMQAIADGYARGSKSIAAATFKTPAELKAAIEKIEAGVETAVDAAVAKAPGLPAGVKSAAQALPACAGLN